MVESEHLLESVQRVTTWMQVGALAVVLGFILGGRWIKAVGARSKSLVDALAHAEATEVENRKLRRDKEIGDLNHRIDILTTKMEGITALTEKREAAQTDRDKEMFARIRAMEQGQVAKGDFATLQSEVSRIDKTMTEVHTKVNMLVENICGHGEKGKL